LIRMFSFPGETVLDPFTGSGTTNVAAARLERNSIGYEINPEFAHSALKRIQSEASLIRDLSVLHEEEKPPTARDITDWIQKLPHRFVDQVKINKRTDPRKLLFGSKITGKEQFEKADYKRPRKVIQEE